MNEVVAFDVYGTLIDWMAMAAGLEPLVGDRAAAFVAAWRDKQIEYAFRRGLMRRYVSFHVCSDQALTFVSHGFGVHISSHQREELRSRAIRLPAFADARSGLVALRERGHRLVAFSNATAHVVRQLLEQAQLMPLMDDVISVDEVQTFKPEPVVYHHLAARVQRSPDQVWLVSSNSWDVIGAKAAGLQAAWIKRNPAVAFDPWEFEPDRVVSGIDQLAVAWAG